MYDWIKKNSLLILGIICIATIAGAGLLGYYLASSKAEIKRITRKFNELQRTSTQAKETASKGLETDRALIKRTGKIKRRIDTEYQEVSDASKGLAQELQEIIEESKTLEQHRLDNGWGKCSGTTRGTSVDSDKINNKGNDYERSKKELKR